jgi:hypothetical protein
MIFYGPTTNTDFREKNEAFTSPRLVVYHVKAMLFASRNPTSAATMLSASTTNATPKPTKKGIKYAKNVEVGSWVHAKGIHVTSKAQLNRWFGTKAMTTYISGIVKEKDLSNVTGRNECFYKVQYDLPDGKTATVSNKAIHHYPGKWVDPNPPPVAPTFGSITKVVRAKVLVGSIANGPPSIINFEEEKEDDISAIVNSQVGNDSVMSTVLLSPPPCSWPTTIHCK